MNKAYAYKFVVDTLFFNRNFKIVNIHCDDGCYICNNDTYSAYGIGGTIGIMENYVIRDKFCNSCSRNIKRTQKRAKLRKKFGLILLFVRELLSQQLLLGNRVPEVEYIIYQNIINSGRFKIIHK